MGPETITYGRPWRFRDPRHHYLYVDVRAATSPAGRSNGTDGGTGVQRESAIIDLVEAAYDLEISDADWLPAILRRGLPVLDRGLGVAGWEYGRPPDSGEVEHRRVHVASGPLDFAERHVRGIGVTPPDVLRVAVSTGRAMTGSQAVREIGHPEALQSYVSQVEYCKDVLYLTAVNATGAGVSIVAPLAEVTTLSQYEERWRQMLAAHIEAAHRLREKIALSDTEPSPNTELPHDAEAILDARRFRVADAVGPAKARNATERLREAAIAIDRARGALRGTDPAAALAGWKALVKGRWSVVDWFDSDSRRFVLAIPNAPQVKDPRGLNKRERQVAWMAAAGMTNKMIAYRLGLSTSRISLVLRIAMRKLGVRTRAQLVSKMRDFPNLEDSLPAPPK